MTDLATRQGGRLEGSADDWWQSSEPVYRYLADHAAEWWVAEDEENGFRLDPMATYLMANRPFGQFDRFIYFSPPLFL